LGSWLNRTEAASERGRIKHPHGCGVESEGVACCRGEAVRVRLPRTHRLRLHSAVITTKAATDAIERVRADHVPAAFEGSDATVLVGGETAFNKGFFDLTDTCTPLIFVS
jgi:hypothetical protein